MSRRSTCFQQHFSTCASSKIAEPPCRSRTEPSWQNRLEILQIDITSKHRYRAAVRRIAAVRPHVATRRIAAVRPRAPRPTASQHRGHTCAEPKRRGNTPAHPPRPPPRRTATEPALSCRSVQDKTGAQLPNPTHPPHCIHTSAPVLAQRQCNTRTHNSVTPADLSGALAATWRTAAKPTQALSPGAH